MAQKRTKTLFECGECGRRFGRWAGRCPECQAWNSLAELSPVEASRSAAAAISSAPAVNLAEIVPQEGATLSTGLPDVDRVFGSGIVAGSFILIAGEPGVGKSTLLLEIARRFPGRFYYFSGEESPAQIRMRADRLGLDLKNIFISRETELEGLCRRLREDRPALAVIDSIQTVNRHAAGVPGGSPGQLREAALSLMEVCKELRLPLLVTGHITKDGSIAGPRMMEHMVDVVLYFESDRLNHFRLLRAVKNRFGPVGEVAIFEMHPGGLREVISPGGVNGRTGHGPGRVYSALVEGSRAIGVEVQALVSRAQYGQTRRMAEGLDNRRLVLMAAVLEKYLKINLADYDIFANLAGGLTGHEPALDLALCAAVLSSYREIPALTESAFVGEVGLSGEIRPVGMLAARIKELANLGFQKYFVPGACAAEISDAGVEIHPLKHISELDLSGIGEKGGVRGETPF